MATIPLTRSPVARPRLALAVGAGGVCSAAAIGVAEVLEESGLRPDAVAGCGAGALVAAMIAIGLYREESMRVARKVWSPEVSRRTRWPSILRLLVPRAGAIDKDFGLRDDREIVRELSVAFGGRRIEDTPMSLRVTATDVATGRSVSLRRGSLEAALRVSAATPLLYPSVEIDGRRLADGAHSDPLALSAVDDAEIVVAIGFPGALPPPADSPSRVLGRAAATLVNNLMRARLENARHAGRCIVYLEPRFDRPVGRWDIAALADMHGIGREAARARVGEIRRLVEDAHALATLPVGSTFAPGA